MQLVSVLIFSLIFINSTQAKISGLQGFYQRKIFKARSILETQGHLEPTANCSETNRNISITLAFGYMDVSAGQDIIDSQTSLYGRGAVLDGDSRQAMETMLMAPCKVLSGGSQAQGCGFKKSRGRLVKTLVNPITGQRYSASIQLVSASVTADDHTNRTRFKAQQIKKSRSTKSRFLSAIATDDVVIYLGHARSGGGPDFEPPVMTSSNRVNYSHYRSTQEGIRSLLGALQSNRKKPQVIGLLACKSANLFARSVKRVAPTSRVVTADHLFDYSDIVPTAYAIIESTLANQCGNSFKKTASAPLGKKARHLSFH